jgi:Skp family chaperone for outer membrane proteins
MIALILEIFLFLIILAIVLSLALIRAFYERIFLMDYIFAGVMSSTGLFDEVKKQKEQSEQEKLKRERERLEAERQRLEKEKKAAQSKKTSESFFVGCDTLEKAKARYKALSRAFHPDTGSGDEESMKQVNSEYEQLLNKLK